MRRRVDNKRFLRFILVVVFIIALIYGVITAVTSFSDKTLKIGLAGSSRPLTYTDDRRNIAGFEAEYARLLAEKLDKKPEIKILNPEDMAGELDSGAIDCVVSVRQSVHDYIAGAYETAPFIAYGVVLVRAPSDDTIGGEEDIAGKRAGLIVNSDAEQLCDELLSYYSFNVRLYDFEVQPFQELQLKKNDFVIADEIFARYMQLEDPDSYLVLDAVYNMSDFGLRLSRRLTQQAAYDIEAAMQSLKDDIRLMDLYISWFGVDLTAFD